MLKSRNPIIITLVSLITASACHRLPLSIGEGIDDAWRDPDGSGAGGTSAGGGTGGAPALDECDATYLSCLESGEQGMICRAIFDQCAGGTAGAGMSFAGAAGVGGSGGTGSGGASPDGTGAAGTGSGGASPDGTGAAGTGGYPANGGAAGGTGLDECDTTYVLCLESGELPEICRDELLRCEMIETGAGGVAGAGGTAGAGAMARD
jgi:hypothetical protein